LNFSLIEASYVPASIVMRTEKVRLFFYNSDLRLNLDRSLTLKKFWVKNILRIGN